MKKTFLLFFNLFVLFSIIGLQAMEEQFSKKDEDIPMAETEALGKYKEPEEKGVEEKQQPPLKRRKKLLAEEKEAFIPLTEEEQEILTEEEKKKRFPSLTELTKRKIIESLPNLEGFTTAFPSIAEELQEDIKKKAQEQLSFEETRLHTAQSPLEVENLLALDVDPNIKDRSGRTALNALIDHGYLNAAFHLAALKEHDKNFNASSTDRFGVSPLQRAIEHKDIELAELILSILEEQYENDMVTEQITFFNTAGNSALFLAIHYNLLELVGKFMEFLDISDLNDANQHGATPLVIAIIYNPVTIETLIKKGANPNFINKDNLTPLMIAAKYNPSIIETLIKNGADPNLIIDQNYTALTFAVKNNPAAIAPLINNGADPNLLNRNGETALARAIEYNRVVSVEILLKNGADPNRGMLGFKIPIEVLHNNETIIMHRILDLNPLEAAIQLGHLEIVKLLLNAGATITEQALDFAKTKPEIDELLNEHLAKTYRELLLP